MEKDLEKSLQCFDWDCQPESLTDVISRFDSLYESCKSESEKIGLINAFLHLTATFDLEHEGSVDEGEEDGGKSPETTGHKEMLKKVLSYVWRKKVDVGIIALSFCAPISLQAIGFTSTGQIARHGLISALQRVAATGIGFRARTMVACAALSAYKLLGQITHVH